MGIERRITDLERAASKERRFLPFFTNDKLEPLNLFALDGRDVDGGASLSELSDEARARLVDRSAIAQAVASGLTPIIVCYTASGRADDIPGWARAWADEGDDAIGNDPRRL